MLAYRWPPQGGGGVQRTLKFVKYLHRLGWRPVVHTVANPHARFRDESLLAEVPPGVPVYRTPTFEIESARAGLVRLGGRLRGWRGGGAQGGGGAGKRERGGAVASEDRPAGDDGLGLGEREARLERGGRLACLEDLVWSRLLVPDPQIAWFPGALLRSLAIARRHRPDVLYSSAPPQSVNVLALAVQRRLGLPWVADLRDPWTAGIHRNQWYPDNPRRAARERAWERAVFERAHGVLVTTDLTRDDFMAAYPWCPPERISVITNGFDPEDFAHLSSTPRFLEPGLFHLTHPGNVESMCDMVPFFSAVRDIVAASPADWAVLRVTFIGTRKLPRYEQFIAEHGLADVIRFRPYVPHADALQYMSESQVLLIFLTPVHAFGGVKVAGKTFEYFQLRKPVLALSVPGVTSRMLESAGLGVTLDPGDVPGIRAAIERRLAEFRAGGVRVRPDEAYIAGFDRSRQAETLARVLESAVAAGPPARSGA